MPRPAQKWSKTDIGSWRETYVRSNGTTTETSGTARKSFRKLDRGAAITSPKDEYGFRDPRPYRVERLDDIGHTAGYSIHEVITPTLRTVITRSGLPGWTFGSPVLAFPQHVKNAAETNTLLKLKDQKVDFSMMLAEYRSTSRMFSDNVTKLAHAVRAVRRGDPRDAMRALDVLKGQRKVHSNWNKKSPAQRWSELQYGVLPLVNDVVGSAEALAKQALDPKGCLITVRASAKDTERMTSKIGSAYSGAFDVRRNVEIDHEARCRLIYYPDPAFIANLSSWGLSNPASTVYNSLPYSFVLDYFLPVGNWLQALDADNGYAFRGGSITMRSVAKVIDYEEPSISISGTTFRKGTTSSMHRRQEIKSVNRLAYGKSPSPWYPSWKQFTAPSGKQITNCLALLVQAFR